MRPLDLPVDAEAMLAGLRPWIECESPTWDAAAVNRMMDLAAHDCAILGAELDRIPGRMGFGDSLRARFPHAAAGTPGILVLGHFDTVHPIGTLALNPFRRDGDRAYGPGILDMKGGNYAALEAIRQLVRAGLETPLPVTILFTPDEEVGTPSARELIEAEAARNRFVLIPEPARDEGAAVIGRYAIARFHLRTRGTASHAGLLLAEGRSAIAEMARRILQIEAMTTEDCTYSVGVVNGGQWVNCVAAECAAEALSTAKTQSDLDRGVARLMDLVEDRGEIAFEVVRSVTRPVWTPGPGTRALLALAQEIMTGMGLPSIDGVEAGGGSDGNFTGALGIPTLDSIGVSGDGLHTLNESVLIDSLPERARLIAGMLMRLA